MPAPPPTQHPSAPVLAWPAGEGDDGPLGVVSLPELEAALDEHVGVLRARFGRLLMRWALVMNALWWPTDFVLVRNIPRAPAALATGRLAVLACGAAVLALLHRQERVVGARFALCCAAWVGLYAGVGYSLGIVGDLGTPWFHMLQPLLVIALVVPMRLSVRLAFTGCIAAALLGGFLARDPASLRSPYLATTVGYLVFSAGVGVFFGHALLLLIRSNLHHRMALERRSAELAAHRARLQDEVRARTDELQRLAQHLERAGEVEGRRIAQELHDELGQGVTALRVALATTRKRFAKNPASIEANLDDLGELVGRVADGTRQAIAHLRPQLLDDQGLVAAVGWLAQSAERRGLACELRVEGRGDPEPGAVQPARLRDVHTAAFRVAQESLTNVLRHARAGRVDVALRFLPAAVEVEVRDDGVGLPPPGARGRGMGLLGMRERARSLGGELSVEPAEGGGTRVRCRLPAAGGAP
ncbi:MAG: sensor histidine kinase [Polyangiales bacterium]